MFKVLSDIVGGSPHSNLPSFEVQWPEVFYGGKILIEYNNPFRFGSHRHCGDNVLIYYVALRDNVFKGLCNYVGRSLS